jgi:hypothetical protein
MHVMGPFPRTEPQILVLANNLLAGLTTAAADFPSPPADVPVLTADIAAYNAALANLVAAQAAAKQATVDKNAALDALVASMRSDLNYAENEVNGDDAKLAQLGWGGKAARSAVEGGQKTRDLDSGMRLLTYYRSSMESRRELQIRIFIVLSTLLVLGAKFQKEFEPTTKMYIHLAAGLLVAYFAALVVQMEKGNVFARCRYTMLADSILKQVTDIEPYKEKVWESISKSWGAVWTLLTLLTLLLAFVAS